MLGVFGDGKGTIVRHEVRGLRLPFGVECQPVGRWPQPVVVDFDRAVMAEPVATALIRAAFRHRPAVTAIAVARAGSAIGRAVADLAEAYSDLTVPLALDHTVIDGLRTIARVRGRLTVLHSGASAPVREILRAAGVTRSVLYRLPEGDRIGTGIAETLTEHHGPRGFSYIGAYGLRDIAFAASHAVLVGGRSRQKAELLTFGVPASTLPRERSLTITLPAHRLVSEQLSGPQRAPVLAPDRVGEAT